ncbi:hypothetical protein GCM10029978_072770 [Actinoallomurus acanthiterrae]
MTTSTTTAAYRPEEDTLGPTITLTTSPAEPKAGDTVTAIVVLTNDCPFALRNTVLYLTNPGETGAAQSIALGNVRRGAKVTRTWRGTVPADVMGTVSFTAHAVFDVSARSADFARVAKRLDLPYVANGVRAPYKTYATTDARYGQSRNQLVIWAGGRDLSGGTDEKGVIYLPGAAADSATLKVRLVDQQGGQSPVAKSGLAIANDLTAPEKGGYAVLTMSVKYGLEFMTDSDGDGHLDTWAGGGNSFHPAWLKLVRSGTTYTAYSSPDGSWWSQVAAATVPSARAACDAGLVASAVNTNYPGETTRAVFDHFNVA